MRSPFSSRQEKPNNKKLSPLMSWAGLILISVGLIWLIISSFIARRQTPVVPAEEQMTYQSFELTEEELAASIPTDFNQDKGTLEQNLGAVEISSDSSSIENEPTLPQF